MKKWISSICNKSKRVGDQTQNAFKRTEIRVKDGVGLFILEKGKIEKQ